ncbi:uncharacterized protein LAESUDRAFT_757935 [Laetiporus sulphureus 93-53]|uniref:DUF6534 domain-containing protein n=1 Tax=Laetiporus sulphureus 93-53 TaxID=1314785 RepID=A0A165F2U9_9APHY|nr:uncharacterized protein LAESUDRAFT_757935 [Laetiporus sulphureus 93-53]KZT08257.1 hypothetical protein LAESUDRAFT_757935 [Laetiporus sulphureus 93-53]
MSGTTLGPETTFTSTFVGMLLCFLFYGGTFSQTIYYFHNSNHDGAPLRVLVIFLWLMDTVKDFLHGQLLWYWFIANHSNPSALLLLPISYTVHFIITAATVLAVQCLYIRNIWTLLKNRPLRKPLTTIGALLTLLSFVCGLVTAYDILSSPTDIVAIERVNVPGRIQGYSVLAVDFYIAVCLCSIFHGARTGCQATEFVITKLIMWTINRAIALFAVQLFVIVTYKPNGTQAMDGVYCFSGTLTVNVALATLNSRQVLKEMQEDSDNAQSSSLLSSFVARRLSSLSTWSRAHEAAIENEDSTEEANEKNRRQESVVENDESSSRH